MELSIYDKTWKYIKSIDVYKSLIWTDRHYENGDFVLVDDIVTELSNLLKVDYFLKIESSEKSMILEQIFVDTSAEDGNQLRYAGRSLESILTYRVHEGVLSLNGNLQDELERVLNENIISPVDADRTISDFEFIKSDDTDITSLTVDAQYFCPDIHTVFTDLCKLNKLGFKIIRLEKEGKYQCYLYKGVDHSYDQLTNPHVTFSPNMDNLTNSKYAKSKAAYSNVSIVAGEGEGANRVIKKTTADDANYSGMDRRESYCNASDLSKDEDGAVLTDEEYAAKLINKGKEQLTKTQIAEVFDGEVSYGSQYTYGEDFKMGDIVQIENEYGMVTKSIVIEWIMAFSDTGFESYPTFDTIQGG